VCMTKVILHCVLSDNVWFTVIWVRILLRLFITLSLIFIFLQCKRKWDSTSSAFQSIQIYWHLFHAYTIATIIPFVDYVNWVLLLYNAVMLMVLWRMALIVHHQGSFQLQSHICKKKTQKGYSLLKFRFYNT
jgi:hypothetical protein